MKSYKIIHAAPDHVVIDDGGGKPFKVAISNRHVATVQKILKMAEGGEVKPKEDDKQNFLKRIFAPKPSTANSSPSVSAAANAIDEQRKRLEQIQASERMARGGVIRRMSGESADPQDQVVKDIENPALGPTAPPPQEYEPSTGAPLYAPPGVDPLGPFRGLVGQDFVSPQGATPAPAPEGVPPGIAAPTEQPPAAAPLPGLPSGQGPPIPGTAEQLAGIKAKAEAETGLGQAQQSAWQQHQTQMAALTAGLQKDYAANQAQADALSKDILAGKVEPNRLWHNMGTGQKVSATIGMILGGIGAGLTGGPNYAAQVIDKAIDRDMEAQKIDLGKKQSQLGYYMQRGHSIQSSYLLAKADAMDRTAAQIQAAQGQFGGQIAQAQAQQAAGLVKQNASMLRQQGYAMTLQNKERELNMAAQQYQMQAMQQMLRGVSGGGGFDRRMLEMPGMDKYRERAVDLPDGSIGFATTKEEAAKSTEAFMSAAKLRDKVAGYRQLLEKGSPLTTDRTSAHAMRADILAEMGHLHGLNRLSDKDLSLFEQQVPDITDVIKPNAGRVLSKLGDSIMDASWAEQQRFLNTPRNKRPPRSR